MYWSRLCVVTAKLSYFGVLLNNHCLLFWFLVYSFYSVVLSSVFFWLIIICHCCLLIILMLLFGIFSHFCFLLLIVHHYQFAIIFIHYLYFDFIVNWVFALSWYLVVFDMLCFISWVHLGWVFIYIILLLHICYLFFIFNIFHFDSSFVCFWGFLCLFVFYLVIFHVVCY